VYVPGLLLPLSGDVALRCSILWGQCSVSELSAGQPGPADVYKLDGKEQHVSEPALGLRANTWQMVLVASRHTAAVTVATVRQYNRGGRNHRVELVVVQTLVVVVVEHRVQ